MISREYSKSTACGNQEKRNKEHSQKVDNVALGPFCECCFLRCFLYVAFFLRNVKLLSLTEPSNKNRPKKEADTFWELEKLVGRYNMQNKNESWKHNAITSYHRLINMLTSLREMYKTVADNYTYWWNSCSLLNINGYF